MKKMKGKLERGRIRCINIVKEKKWRMMGKRRIERLNG